MSNKTQKTQILTLVPEYLRQRLENQEGILEVPQSIIVKRTSQATVDRVLQSYKNSKYKEQLPRKKVNLFASGKIFRPQKS